MGKAMKFKKLRKEMGLDLTKKSKYSTITTPKTVYVKDVLSENGIRAVVIEKITLVNETKKEYKKAKKEMKTRG